MRQPKPYIRKQTGSWYVQIGKKQILLGRDKDEAFRKYHELMAGQGDFQTRYSSVAELLDDYLCWLEDNRKPATFSRAKHYLVSFAQHVGLTQTITGLKPASLTQWIEVNKTWASGTTRHDAISTVQRAFNWAPEAWPYLSFSDRTRAG